MEDICQETILRALQAERERGVGEPNWPQRKNHALPVGPNILRSAPFPFNRLKSRQYFHADIEEVMDMLSALLSVIPAIRNGDNVRAISVIINSI